ncbi:MAG: NFACT RNA binding domain-containing protein [Treponema sp.]|jgi:predicted ribosome quality control (RQC) complex YloA/Tae2 family protein|nr:NFACT RNA binding domain-containing protein [Treponema sp.]
MSLNWKEINLILSELDLPGSQIQRVIQSAYDVLVLQIYGKGGAKNILISLTPGACRVHQTYGGIPKTEKPLRFAEFLKSRILNGRIEGAEQLGDNRILRLLIRQGTTRYRLYARLWSNAANVIVTGEDGTILDAMRRLPKRGELTGGHYEPEAAAGELAAREYAIRELPGDLSFNEKIDAWYAEHGGALSLESLREQARRTFEGSMGRLKASLERLRAKEADYAAADRFKEYGNIIMANMASIRPGDAWLDADNFYTGEQIRIKLNPKKGPAVQGELYYEQYRKAKNGLADVRAELAAGERELAELEAALEQLLAETNPLKLHRLLKNRGLKPAQPADRKRPGLSFRVKDWLIIVGRDAAENDALLRRHVKGNDLWLHARDYPGSYVFIKQRSGKTVPLEILLDAGSLALFYSKGRNNGEGDLFYTPVKFLRRAKDGPKGLVIPSQEKNLHIKVDERRLKELEHCRIV